MHKNISIIVAIAKNFAIGKDNKLLCHLPEDLKRFKRITTGNVVIMGKKTYESLPNGALPDRINIVISDNRTDTYPGCVMAYSIEEAIHKMSEEKENFIIGGGSIYKQFLPLANTLYLTILHKDYEADTFFPEICFSQWDEIQREEWKGDEKNEAHTFLILKRKKQPKQ